jgi:hypothetical protein
MSDADPTRYSDWPKYAEHERKRRELWEFHDAYKQKHGHNAWTVLCHFCDNPATICFANNLDREGSVRISVCQDHIDDAAKALEKDE